MDKPRLFLLSPISIRLFVCFHMCMSAYLYACVYVFVYARSVTCLFVCLSGCLGNKRYIKTSMLAARAPFVDEKEKKKEKVNENKSYLPCF